MGVILPSGKVVDVCVGCFMLLDCRRPRITVRGAVGIGDAAIVGASIRRCSSVLGYVMMGNRIVHAVGRAGGVPTHIWAYIGTVRPYS